MTLSKIESVQWIRTRGHLRNDVRYIYINIYRSRGTPFDKCGARSGSPQLYICILEKNVSTSIHGAFQDVYGSQEPGCDKCWSMIHIYIHTYIPTIILRAGAVFMIMWGSLRLTPTSQSFLCAVLDNLWSGYTSMGVVFHFGTYNRPLITSNAITLTSLN